LVVTTIGHGGNDFAVTFEPIDNGRNLRATRRIADDNLRQPVTVRSFYRKSSDQAQWDVYSTQGAPSPGVAHRNGSLLCERTSPVQQPNEEQHDCGDQQHMDERANGVGPDDPEQPRD
jgi:hypothetical protein